MPLVVYNKFVKGYTLNQLGVNPKFLDSKLALRIFVRTDHESRLTLEYKVQALPYGGYKNFIEKLLKDIPRLLVYIYD